LAQGWLYSRVQTPAGQLSARFQKAAEKEREGDEEREEKNGRQEE